MRGVLIWAAIALLAAPARADELEDARELYKRGRHAYDLQQWDLALDRFQAAYGAREDPALLYNIAQCQRRLGQYEAAAISYRLFASRLPEAPQAATALQMARQMDDEAAAARAPRPQPPETEPQAMLAPPVAAPLVVVAPVPRLDPRRSLRLAGIAATGLGAGLLAAGGVFAGVAASAGEDALHHDAYDYAADQRLHSFRAGAIASFAIGGALTAAGVTMWVMGRRR